MKVNIVKPQQPTQLPDAFLYKVSTKSNWHSFLDRHPSLEAEYQWMSGARMREFFPVLQRSPQYIVFNNDEKDYVVYTVNPEQYEDWPVME